MKKLLFCLFALVALTACEGDPGPVGPPGAPGNGVMGQTFEFEAVNFTYEPANNLYSTLITIPQEIEVYDSDAILVYRLSSVPAQNGGSITTYSLIPQNYFLPQGTIQYVYNHSINDVELMIDGNFNLGTLGARFTKNQIFRFVVVPSEFANDPTVDITTYEKLQGYGLDMHKF